MKGPGLFSVRRQACTGTYGTYTSRDAALPAPACQTEAQWLLRQLMCIAVPSLTSVCLLRWQKDSLLLTFMLPSQSPKQAYIGMLARWLRSFISDLEAGSRAAPVSFLRLVGTGATPACPHASIAFQAHSRLWSAPVKLIRSTGRHVAGSPRWQRGPIASRSPAQQTILLPRKYGITARCTTTFGELDVFLIPSYAVAMRNTKTRTQNRKLFTPSTRASCGNIGNSARTPVAVANGESSGKVRYYQLVCSATSLLYQT